jgi:hypothetical protein
MTNRANQYKVVRIYNVVDTYTGNAVDAFNTLAAAKEYADYQNGLARQEEANRASEAAHND